MLKKISYLFYPPPSYVILQPGWRCQAKACKIVSVNQYMEIHESGLFKMQVLFIFLVQVTRDNRDSLLTELLAALS